VRNYFWAKGQGVYPADAALNADSHGMSAGIREAIAMLAATMEFRGTSQTIKRLSGINLCAETCRQVTLREGYRIAEVIKDGTLTPSFQPEQAVVTPAGEQTRLYLGVDGVLVPTVTQSEKVKRRESHSKRRMKRQRAGLGNSKRLPPPRPGSDQRYKEMKLGYFYDQSKRLRHAFVTSGDHDAFGVLLKEQAGRLGLQRARERISLFDDAEWIRWQVYVSAPGLTMMLLDFYHLSQHVHGTALACMGETAEAKEWAAARLHEFKYRGAAEPLGAVEALGRRVRSRAGRESVGRLKKYITERLEMLDYPTARARGYDIGSGPTEAMCKNLTLRLKQSGMKWDTPNAAAVMTVIALFENGQAAAYWARKAA